MDPDPLIIKGIVQPLKSGVLGGINRKAFKILYIAALFLTFLKDPAL
jgi:hypothetical protein